MSKKLPKAMYDEALLVLEQSETLMETVEWQYNKVMELVNQYSEEEFDALPWDVKEGHLQKCEEIHMRLVQSSMELKRLDERYNALKERVKEKFGRDVLPPLTGDMRNLIEPDDEGE